MRLNLGFRVDSGCSREHERHRKGRGLSEKSTEGGEEQGAQIHRVMADLSASDPDGWVWQTPSVRHDVNANGNSGGVKVNFKWFRQSPSARARTQGEKKEENFSEHSRPLPGKQRSFQFHINYDFLDGQ